MNFYSKFLIQFNANRYRNCWQKLYFFEIENVLVRLSLMWWFFDQSKVNYYLPKKSTRSK